MKKELFFTIALFCLFSISFAGISVESYTCDTAVAVGETLTCTARIKNTGSSSLTVSAINMFLSTPNWAEATSYSGTGYSSSIAASAMTSATFIITPTTSGTCGFDYLKLTSDTNYLTDTTPASTTVNVINLKDFELSTSEASTLADSNFFVNGIMTSGGSVNVTMNLTIDSGGCTLTTGESSTKHLGLLSDNTVGSSSWQLTMGSTTCAFTVVATGTSGAIEVTKTASSTQSLKSPVCGNGVVEGSEECEADSDCASGYTCSSCACQAPTTTSVATGSETITRSLNLTLSKATLSFSNEDTTSFTATVGNDGNRDIENVEVYIDDIEGFATFSISPASVTELEYGKTANFIVTVTPESTDVSDTKTVTVGVKATYLSGTTKTISISILEPEALLLLEEEEEEVTLSATEEEEAIDMLGLTAEDLGISELTADAVTITKTKVKTDVVEISTADIDAAIILATDEDAIAALESAKEAAPSISGKVAITRTLDTYTVQPVGVGTSVDRSVITLTVSFTTAMKDVKIIEVIPKIVAESSNDLVFATAPTILQADPIVMWGFATVRAGETKDLSYVVKKMLTTIESYSVVGAEVEEAEITAAVITEEEEEEIGIPITAPPSKGLSGAAIAAIVISVLVVVVLGMLYKTGQLMEIVAKIQLELMKKKKK